MSVLASDKTGTLTENKLILGAVYPFPPYHEDEVIRLGAFASEEASQDPLDIAILSAARERSLNLAGEILHFTPFEPALKRSEAVVRLENGSKGSG
jgi:H+-transporting ATPase